MVAFEHFADMDDVWGLTERVESLRDLVANEARPILQGFGPEAASLPGIVNLAHYLALRHHDVRPLQRALMRHGLSSLGRLESRVLPTLDAVLVALAARAGRQSPVPLPSSETFFAGEARLEQATDLMFGPPPAHRRSRIMVTLAARRPRTRLSLPISCAAAWISPASTAPMTDRRPGGPWRNTHGRRAMRPGGASPC